MDERDTVKERASEITSKETIHGAVLNKKMKASELT